MPTVYSQTGGRFGSQKRDSAYRSHCSKRWQQNSECHHSASGALQRKYDPHPSYSKPSQIQNKTRILYIGRWNNILPLSHQLVRKPKHWQWALHFVSHKESTLLARDCLPVSLAPSSPYRHPTPTHTHALWLWTMCEAPLPSFSQVTVTGIIARLILLYYISRNRRATQEFVLLGQESKNIKFLRKNLLMRFRVGMYVCVYVYINAYIYI